MEWDWGIAASRSEGAHPTRLHRYRGPRCVLQRRGPEPSPPGLGQRWGTFRLERCAGMTPQGYEPR